MPGAVQWTVDQFMAQLQGLKGQIDQADAALVADKARLTQMYTYAREHYDPARDVYLAPLIHRNSVLRLSYLNPVKQKYTEAVNAAAGVLRSAGLNAPNLSGLGVLPLVPVIAVAAVVVALAAVAIVWRLTQAQVARTNAMAAIFSDPSMTPDQKVALSRQQQAQMTAEDRASPPPLGFNFNDLLPIVAVIAAIVLVPPILKMLPARRATA